MEKTLSLETSKRLVELLKDKPDTDYRWFDNFNHAKNYLEVKFAFRGEDLIKKRHTGVKTLTLEEAFDILPDYSHFFRNKQKEYIITNHVFLEKRPDILNKNPNIRGKTKIECVERFLEYLLKYDLLGEKKKKKL